MSRKTLTLVALTAALAAAGCAQDRNSQRPELPLGPSAYAPRAAAALAFDPPMAMAGPAVPLDRAGRAPEAFAGYEQQTISTSASYVHDDLRAYTPYGGRIEREAWSNRSTVISR